MADYIDREKIFSIWRSMPAPASVTSLAAAISQTPAADVAEVRHGRWLDEDFPDKPATVHGMAICSVCGGLSHKAEHGYNILSNCCPNCGAKMWEEAADEI